MILFTQIQLHVHGFWLTLAFEILFPPYPSIFLLMIQIRIVLDENKSFVTSDFTVQGF